MTAAEIQAALDDLDAKIAKAATVQSASFADQSTTFRSMDEMLKYRASLAQQLKAAGGSSTTRFAATSKGV